MPADPARLDGVTVAERAGAHMVDALCAAGRIRSPAVEQAFRAVPRHLFLPDSTLTEAYADEAVPTRFADGAATSSASQPSMMAIMLEQLDLRPGHRVLEIGAGTGYNAALIATIVGDGGAVTAVDIDQDLVDGAAGHLTAAGPHLAAAGAGPIRLVCGDGALGHPDDAPYDRIVLTVGSDDVRPEWVAQLAPGGRLLLPLALRGSQLSVALDLGPDGLLRSDSVQSCMFIRLRGIGSVGQDRVVLDGSGLVVEAPGDTAPLDPARLVAALNEPGPVLSPPFGLRAADIWDGFGLWLALTEPRAFRLIQPRPEVDDEADTEEMPVVRSGGIGDDLLPVGPATATVALTSASGPPGIAAVITTERGGQAIRPFGPAGVELAAALVGSMQAWAAVGRPSAPDWRVTVLPGDESEAGPAVVAKRHGSVQVELRAV